MFIDYLAVGLHHVGYRLSHCASAYNRGGGSISIHGRSKRWSASAALQNTASAKSSASAAYHCNRSASSVRFDRIARRSLVRRLRSTESAWSGVA